MIMSRIFGSRERRGARRVQKPMQLGERVLAVLFADVSGSTALYEALGDHEAHRVIAGCLDLLRSTALEFSGRIVKFIGDELLCVFDEADAAICAASQMQTRLAEQHAIDAEVPAVRIGIAQGRVLEDAGDVFGDTVNLASRVADVARSAQVLTTRQTVQALTPAIRGSCRSLHPIELKGIDGDVPIFEVVWNIEATLTMVVDTHASDDPDAALTLVLTHQGKDVRLDAEHRVARLGRDASNDLVVPAKTASRWHARVQLRDHNFMLVDASVNGTFVRFDGKPELHLRREETVLVGRGVIGLGESTLGESAATVDFIQQ